MSTADTFIAMQQSPETRRAYAQDMRRWESFSGEQAMTADLVIAFRDWLSETLAPASAARCFSTIRTFYRWLVQSGEAERNLFDMVKGPRTIKNKAPKVPDDDAVNALVSTVASDPFRRCIVALLLNGLRVSEVTNLDKDDVTWVEGRMVLRVVGKGNKERLVPATVESNNAVLAWLASGNEAQRTSSVLLPDVYGARLGYRAIEHYIYRAAKAAGVKMHPHALRHHYATRLIRAGASPLHVRDLLGHTSVATTQIYVSLDLSDLIEATDLDPRAGAATPTPMAVVA